MNEEVKEEIEALMSIYEEDMESKNLNNAIFFRELCLEICMNISIFNNFLFFEIIRRNFN